MAYLSISDVNGRLGTAMTADQAAYFNATLLPSIVEQINFMAGTVFENSDSGEVYADGTDSNMLIIPTMSEVTAVYSVDEDGTETLVDESAYRTYPSGKDYIYALRNKNGTWAEGFENYRIEGTIGYDEVPGDIRAIAMEMAIANLNANMNSYKSERVGDWSVTYADPSSGSDLSSGSIATLKRYARLSRSV